MSGVPYTFASATSSIPLSELDTNFATPVTIGTTSVALGNTVTTLANVALANVTISSVASGIPNNFLANSSVTIGNTSVALGNTVTSLGNVTLTNATISSVASQIPAAAMPTGSVIQVVQYTDNTLRTSTSNVAVYSGFSANITPQFSTSKILVIFNGSLSVNGNTNSNIIMGGAIYRGSSTQLNGLELVDLLLLMEILIQHLHQHIWIHPQQQVQLIISFGGLDITQLSIQI